ncbi:MAG: sortase, partial [Anaerolineae bacterium]
GNVVLAAHNDIYGEYFRYLDTMQLGDQFTIQTDTQVFTYTVTGTDIVAPTDVSVMDNRDGATVTLISCYPYGENTHRYIVYANRDAS